MAELTLVMGAFLAGVLMFLAPCTLPIVPGYLAFIGGRRVVANAVAFAIGFSVVFITLGAFAGSLGALVGPYRGALSQAAGLIIMLFGLTMLGALRLPLVGGEWHARMPNFLTRGRIESSFLIGALFALGWSPCIGPILGTILLLASASSTAAWGAFLLGIFSLGLALPFILTALLLERAVAAFGRWGRAAVWLQYFGGVLLVLIGLYMALGTFGHFTTWALEYIPGYAALLPYL